MKKLLFVMALSGSILLAGCNSPESSTEEINQENNLLNVDTLNDEGWINFDGEVSSSANEMVHSETIPYISEKEYIINDSVYISYFNDEEFIKTVLHDGEEPITVDTVKDANNIQLSFTAKKAKRIVLSEK